MREVTPFAFSADARANIEQYLSKLLGANDTTRIDAFISDVENEIAFLRTIRKIGAERTASEEKAVDFGKISKAAQKLRALLSELTIEQTIQMELLLGLSAFEQDAIENKVPIPPVGNAVQYYRPDTKFIREFTGKLTQLEGAIDIYLRNKKRGAPCRSWAAAFAEKVVRHYRERFKKTPPATRNAPFEQLLALAGSQAHLLAEDWHRHLLASLAKLRRKEEETDLSP